MEDFSAKQFKVKIDSHQHFWKYDPEQYPWIQPGWPIKRDFLPEDLAPELKNIGFDGSIAVQARQTLEETKWLLQLAKDYPIVAGVVGWVDLRGEEVEKQLEEFADDRRLVGVRHVVQEEPDDYFMVREPFLNGISKLRKYGLAYDILIYPKQLPSAIQLVKKFPEQIFILDHIGKPNIRVRQLDPWRIQVQNLANCPNVYCKVSGMVTEAEWQRWKPADIRPYLDVVFDSFGPERLMIGSDWPVALNAAKGYGETMGLVLDYIEELSQTEQEQVCGKTALEAYFQSNLPSR